MQADLLQSPPHNIEAEEAILGSILLDSQAIYRIRDEIAPEYFYVHSHQIICRAMIELADKGKVTDLMNVATFLSDKNLLQQAGGQPKLVQLVERTVTSINVDQYTPLVREKYIRRELIKAGYELITLAHQTEIPIEDVRSKSLDVASKVFAEEIGNNKPRHISASMESLFNKLSSGETTGYSTGLLDLDDLIQYKPTELIVVGGRPSMGKTWMGCFIAYHLAKTYHKPIVFFTAEMSEEEIAGRFLAMDTEINSEQINRNKINEDQWPIVAEGVGRLSELPIIFDPTPASKLTPAHMHTVLRMYQAIYGEIGAVVLDYLQLIADEKRANQVDAIAAVSKACKSMAKEFNTPFFTLVQFNRESENRSGNRPTMRDAKGSGQIEQDANIFIGLHREEYYDKNTNKKGICELIVLKNRGGKTGTAEVLFDPAVGNYKSIARPRYEY